ncbi:ubiquitin-conjugating enzyme/RWD-like protein [Umbelopsis sp. PMI_123]|nr:ubiquitin-conjugating enzyme/RWD-like protein [Umbelopsis sp. PMI_123]
MLEHEPPPGIICYPVEDDCTHLEAHIKGPVDSPFEIGTFKLDIQIPQRYPFDPPQMRFITPIYHPNIDEAGRICADILKMPPAGNWVPALNLSTVLLALSGLMSEPNPDDPLEMEIVSNSISITYHRLHLLGISTI